MTLPGGYTLPEATKAVVAALTAAVALLTSAAAVFTDGPLAKVGVAATAALLIANPILVYVKTNAPLADAYGRHAVKE
ncbi:hypothetical protein [Aeromicrobium sp.]|uniref:hypothetical protein n=1 Tax=Aeromicrobium sp. TaxID=1871063 RepID=UPI00199C3B59|nr:hypothetical protein [Aeromicrobium sp.]MBC7630322.1 hypothetical protein [Aeromicrobium sp.]